jgi:dsRNA-specific ribonuclease
MGDIEAMKVLSNKYPEYEIAYSCEDGGPETAKQYTYTYKMGERVIGKGVPKTLKLEAKASAAREARTTLDQEGYRIDRPNTRRREDQESILQW